MEMVCNIGVGIGLYPGGKGHHNGVEPKGHARYRDGGRKRSWGCIHKGSLQGHLRGAS